MNDRPVTIPPELLRKSGEVALLTVIDAVLNVPVDGLPDRVALVRRYLEAALDTVTDSRRTAFLVIAQMLARDANRDGVADGGDPCFRR